MRVKPLDNKADGNLLFGPLRVGVKKSNVLFRPGVNTTLRDIFVLTAATSPDPHPRTCSPVWRHIPPPHPGVHSTLTPDLEVVQGWLSMRLLLSFRATLDPEGKRFVLVSDGGPSRVWGPWCTEHGPRGLFSQWLQLPPLDVTLSFVSGPRDRSEGPWAREGGLGRHSQWKWKPLTCSR